MPILEGRPEEPSDIVEPMTHLVSKQSANGAERARVERRRDSAMG